MAPFALRKPSRRESAWSAEFGGQLRLLGAGRDEFRGAHAGGAAEHHEIDQRIGAEPVGAMDGDAGRLAERHQAGDDDVRIAILLDDDLAVIIGRDAAHVVMHRRQHRDRLLGQIDAGENLGALRNSGQALMQDLRIEMIEVEIDVILVLADAAAFADLHRHGARNHVARRKILHGGRIALHEALAGGIGQIAAFAARAFGDEAARAIDAGRMELHELHVLQRQSRAQNHGVAVAGAGMRRGAEK